MILNRNEQSEQEEKIKTENIKEQFIPQYEKNWFFVIVDVIRNGLWKHTLR